MRPDPAQGLAEEARGGKRGERAAEKRVGETDETSLGEEGGRPLEKMCRSIEEILREIDAEEGVCSMEGMKVKGIEEILREIDEERACQSQEGVWQGGRGMRGERETGAEDPRGAVRHERGGSGGSFKGRGRGAGAVREVKAHAIVPQEWRRAEERNEEMRREGGWRREEERKREEEMRREGERRTEEERKREAEKLRDVIARHLGSLSPPTPNRSRSPATPPMKPLSAPQAPRGANRRHGVSLVHDT